MELNRVEQDKIENFIVRYNENRNKKRINNADLPPGAPTYYYCHGCFALVEVMPATELNSPKFYCDHCEDLLNEGLFETAQRKLEK